MNIWIHIGGPDDDFVYLLKTLFDFKSLFKDDIKIDGLFLSISPAKYSFSPLLPLYRVAVVRLQYFMKRLEEYDIPVIYDTANSNFSETSFLNYYDNIILSELKQIKPYCLYQNEQLKDYVQDQYGYNMLKLQHKDNQFYFEYGDRQVLLHNNKCFTCPNMQPCMDFNQNALVNYKNASEMKHGDSTEAIACRDLFNCDNLRKITAVHYTNQISNCVLWRSPQETEYQTIQNYVDYLVKDEYKDVVLNTLMFKFEENVKKARYNQWSM